MKRMKMLAIAAFAIALTVAPLSASATAGQAIPIELPDEGPNPGDGDFVRPGACRHAWMHLFHDTGIRREPKNNSTIIGTAWAGWHECRALTVGDLYTGCNGLQNTGWILIPLHRDTEVNNFNPPDQGWIISNCTQDPVLPWGS